jgi:hypothetical protein
MSPSEKATRIRTWINPAERITVRFEDQHDLNAEVTGRTEQLVDLALETTIPHMRQDVSIALGDVELAEDFGHYTRDPVKPLRYQRLMLVIRGKRPALVY